MAKKEEESKIILEREYNVPLRREWIKSPRWKKTNKAVRALREFLAKHMKVEDRDVSKVKIGKSLNEEMWKHGIRNPPHHIKVIAKKDDKGNVTVELFSAPSEEKIEAKEKKQQERKENRSWKERKC
jgi:large subunit ribosomal protein L31e